MGVPFVGALVTLTLDHKYLLYVHFGSRAKRRQPLNQISNGALSDL